MNGVLLMGGELGAWDEAPWSVREGESDGGMEGRNRQFRSDMYEVGMCEWVVVD